MRRNTKKSEFFKVLVEKFQTNTFYSYEILNEMYLYGVNENEVSGLLNALKNEGVLENIQERITRNGRVQCVWKLTSEGIAEYQRLMGLGY